MECKTLHIPLFVTVSAGLQLALVFVDKTIAATGRILPDESFELRRTMARKWPVI